jgi:hypothetical protein
MSYVKDQAEEFLRVLGKSILRNAPRGAAMAPEIRRIVSDAKKNDGQKHLRLPEAAFLNTFAVPALFRYLQENAGLTTEQAREALRNEYHRTMPEYSLQSPIRALPHPFKKLLGAKPETIYREWRNVDKSFGLTQSAPDFALGKPFPHSILFEGKYFASGTQDYAARQLVVDLYQAFFYRGLSPLEATKRHPEWDYDYVCLLAFDASPKGTLLAAWDALDAKVKKSFWDGANIYVMILRN